MLANIRNKTVKRIAALALLAGLAFVGLFVVLRIQGYLAYQPYKARLEERLKPSTSQTYYISPQGNDSNLGTSKAQPWQSLARANAVRFNPGDQLLMQGGETFRGNLLFDQDDIATVLQPITISSYGQGAATIEVPSGNGITLSNTMAFRVTNLKLVGPTQGKSKSGILVVNDRSGDLKLPSIRLDHLDIARFGGYGILIDGNRGKSGFRDVLIDHVAAHDNGWDGIVVNGQFNPRSSSYAHRNVRITYCKSYGNYGKPGKNIPHSGSGIVLSDVQDGIIDHSEAFNNGARSESAEGGPVGIWAWDADRVVIEKNYAHDNRVAGLKDGGGLDLDGGVTNSIMQYNYSYNNDGSGLLVCQFPYARRFSGNTVRYNVSIDDGRRNGYGSIFLFGGVEDTSIYNNSVFVSSVSQGKQPKALHIDKSAVKRVSFRNNIFVSSGGLETIVVEPGQDQLTLQGNNYFSQAPGNSFLVRWDDRLYTNMAEWCRQTGQEKLGFHDLGLNVNPQFQGDPLSSPAVEAMRLEAGSPLINAGLNLEGLFSIETGDRDFAGRPVPLGSGYDLGAIEWADTNSTRLGQEASATIAN